VTARRDRFRRERKKRDASASKSKVGAILLDRGVVVVGLHQSSGCRSRVPRIVRRCGPRRRSPRARGESSSCGGRRRLKKQEGDLGLTSSRRQPLRICKDKVVLRMGPDRFPLETLRALILLVEQHTSIRRSSTDSSVGRGKRGPRVWLIN